MQLPPTHTYHPADTQTHKHAYTQWGDPGAEDMNNLRAESVLCPQVDNVNPQSLTAVTPGCRHVCIQTAEAGFSFLSLSLQFSTLVHPWYYTWKYTNETESIDTGGRGKQPAWL